MSAVRRPQDGAFFKGPAYPGYPFLMIPDLSSPYLSNGPLSPGGARTVSVRPAVPGPVGAGLGGMRPQARPWCGGWGLLRRSWAELVCGVKLPCGGLVRDCIGQCRDESKDLLTFRLWEILLALGDRGLVGSAPNLPKSWFFQRKTWICAYFCGWGWWSRFPSWRPVNFPLGKKESWARAWRSLA